MLDKIHFMLDIETLGVGPNAVITEIACAPFMLEKQGEDGGVIREFFFDDFPNNFYHTRVDVRKQTENGRSMDQQSVNWWISQNIGKFTDFFVVAPSPDFVAEGFTNFLLSVAKQCSIVVWARDPDFDCVLMRNFLESYELKIPWSYSQTRSHRTLLDVSGKLNTRHPTFAHNADIDCLLQIKTTIQSFDKLELPGCFFFDVCLENVDKALFLVEEKNLSNPSLGKKNT